MRNRSRRRVRDEEPVLLIGSPMCWASSTLIELTQATGKLSEVEYRSLMERCVTYLQFCFRMCEAQRDAGRLFLQEHPCGAWSRGLSFVNEMAEKHGGAQVEGSRSASEGRRFERRTLDVVVTDTKSSAQLGEKKVAEIDH